MAGNPSAARWLGRAVWFTAGLGVGSWIYPFREFVTQAVLGHSPLNPVSEAHTSRGLDPIRYITASQR